MARLVHRLSFLDLNAETGQGTAMVTRAGRVGESSPRYFSAQVEAARRFHLRVRSGGSRGVVVISGGWERCTSEYLIDRPGFPHVILEFVAGGAGRLEMKGRTHALAPGAVFVYGRGVPHRIITDRRHPLTKYFVVLGGRGAGALLRAHGLSPGAVVHVAEPERLRRIFDDLIEFALGHRQHREAGCAQTLHYLVLKAGDMIVPAGGSAARAYATYVRCRTYMEEQVLSNPSLRDVAAACHVDAAYLSRLFQRFGRERPSHYLQHLRMNQAAALLQTSTGAVKEVAEAVGFTDPANFTRAFRRWFGVPPQTLRRQ